MKTKTNDEMFMKKAIELSEMAVEHGNEPFGAVLVKDGEIVFTNENQIYTMHDPTFHGEAGLIRRFCAETGITDLRDYTLYSSCEPCFMCSGAMVWTKLGRLSVAVKKTFSPSPVASTVACASRFSPSHSTRSV